MKLVFINNWHYKANWNKLAGFAFHIDIFNFKHVVIGFFNFFLFIYWR